MDYSKLNDINYYIDYAIGDTEGRSIDGGEKYGGTTIVYFPNKEEVDKYAGLPAIGNRRKIYGTMVMDYEKGDVLKLELRNWDGTPVDTETLKKQTIMILYDKIKSGKEVNYTGELFRRCDVGEIYAYTPRIDEDVFDRKQDCFMETLDSGIIGEIYTSDTSLYDKHERITLIDELFFDYFNDL